MRATGRHLPYGITQCYLPLHTSERAPAVSEWRHFVITREEYYWCTNTGNVLFFTFFSQSSAVCCMSADVLRIEIRKRICLDPSAVRTPSCVVRGTRVMTSATDVTPDYQRIAGLVRRRHIRAFNFPRRRLTTHERCDAGPRGVERRISRCDEHCLWRRQWHNAIKVYARRTACYASRSPTISHLVPTLITAAVAACQYEADRNQKKTF